MARHTEREPRLTARTLCVLTGDVQGFSGLMRVGTDAAVRQALEEAVRKWTRETIAAEVRSGDTVSVVHDDPVVLAQVARHLVDEVPGPGPARSADRAALRRGAARRRPSDGALVIAGGDAVLCAARVEPHVEPGQIWVTEEFRTQLAESPPCGEPPR